MGDDKGDLIPRGFPDDLQWSESEAHASLEKLYQFVNDECDRASKWYFRKRHNKRILGYTFRVGAILALATSGIIPVLCETLKIPEITPGWATVALGITALFLSIDRFGGYTSGWIRYIRAGQTLNGLQSSFRIEWERERLILQGCEVNANVAEEAIRQCRAFLSEVNSIVSAETDEWAREFRLALVEMEKKTKESYERATGAD